MTQLFTSSSGQTSGVRHEKRSNFAGISLATKKHSSNDSSHFPTKLKNFFRINSSSSTNSNSNNNNNSDGSHGAVGQNAGSSGSGKSETKMTFRQSRFLPTITRNRSTTTASEGNLLDEGMSPTAHANPYFAHQGHPALRHRNDGSVSSVNADTPELQVDGVAAGDQATTAGKEELARKLRRVASAPNAQGLFSSGKSDERPRTAELGKEPLVEHGAATGGVGVGDGARLSLVDAPSKSNSLAVPGVDELSNLPPPSLNRNPIAFRRTYSSNSIKVRNVEVGPGSFDKIKLIGKGDVGKVYLVREKKSSRLYAMKARRR
ncbi:serine/threonine-protein kinase nrc-2 [Histoplasma capsulatum]|uniref:Serine/threonine-protein kinase nrc-2 n=1 Tax=Ajellomyces capsulatus TaxID=5037 RepID=A0A8A1M1E9_AJECA|nr:serine/threonine-protein kinase nrc-2 [Histoplasma capsulatum]